MATALGGVVPAAAGGKPTPLGGKPTPASVRSSAGTAAW